MPSTSRHANSVRNAVEISLRAEVPPIQVARELRVSHTWIFRLRLRLDAFDTVSPAPLSVQGRPRKIHQAAREGVAEFLDQNNTVYQDEIMDFLAEEFGITVSQPTISRLLKQLQITHKRLSAPMKREMIYYERIGLPAFLSIRPTS